MPTLGLFDDLCEYGVGSQRICTSMGRSAELTRPGRHNVALRCGCCPDLSTISSAGWNCIRPYTLNSWMWWVVCPVSWSATRVTKARGRPSSWSLLRTEKSSEWSQTTAVNGRDPNLHRHRKAHFELSVWDARRATKARLLERHLRDCASENLAAFSSRRDIQMGYEGRTRFP